MTADAWPGTPFKVQTSEEILADIRERLTRARLPEQQAGEDWETGTPLGYAERLRDYWLEKFDWRAWEARINALEQRIVEVDGQPIHVIVEQGSGSNPLPLVMTNGWPGSFLEFIDLVEPLAHPERFGGNVEDGFTVVIPSLPGYGFSSPPPKPLSPPDIAGLWSRLAVDAFGFDRYIAYGSDWGSLVTAYLSLHHPERLASILITTQGLFPHVDESSPPITDEEKLWQQGARERMMPLSAYQALQGTRPQSLAYGHTDSPLALACWIIEKFHDWTILGKPDDPPFSMDELIANAMLYWLNGSIAPMWLYLYLGQMAPVPPGTRVSVPANFLLSPEDLLAPAPRSWLERVFDVGRYTLSEGGGHFPGMDNAELLVSELRAVGRQVR